MLARNLLVKKNMKRDMRQMLLDMQRGDSNDDFSWLSCKVFCLATKLYMTLMGSEKSQMDVGDLTVNDTEMPHLVQEIQMQLPLRWNVFAFLAHHRFDTTFPNIAKGYRLTMGV